jgi:hypothetical protein
MDADDLARIAAGLVAAITQAKTRAKEFGIGPDFREIVRQAQEMHDLLTESLIENEPLSTTHLRQLSDTTRNAIERLETLVRMPNGEIRQPRADDVIR